jgi:hypothetical protein
MKTFMSNQATVNETKSSELTFSGYEVCCPNGSLACRLTMWSSNLIIGSGTFKVFSSLLLNPKAGSVLDNHPEALPLAIGFVPGITATGLMLECIVMQHIFSDQDLAGKVNEDKSEL